MTDYPQPSISVNVDVTNPGQFFACCGLLELADRVWPANRDWRGCEAWFQRNGFCVVGPDDQSVDVLINRLMHSRLQPDSTRTEKTLWPISFQALDLTLDWWIDNTGQKTPLKLWAGQQTSLGIVEKLRDALNGSASALTERLFDGGQPLTGRFGVDPRAAWQALDVGFSPNTQGMEVATYPAVELLAAIGMQRFRPMAERRGFCYTPWTTPLSACVARAACAGLIPSGRSQRFRFQIAVRGSYKGFDFAIPVGE